MTQYNKSNPMFVQTFKILGFIVPEKSDTNFTVLHLSETQKKKTKKKTENEDKIHHMQQSSTLCSCIQNLKTPALIGPERSVTKSYIREKE